MRTYLPGIKRSNKFKRYTGRITEQMPLLISEGRIPLSTSQIMEERVKSCRAPIEIKDFWWNSNIVSGDARAYNPNTKEVLLILDSEHLREIELGRNKTDGGGQRWLLGENKKEGIAEYEELRNKEDTYSSIYERDEPDRNPLIKGYFAQFHNKQRSRKNVKSDPIWRFLAKDQNLLDEYVDCFFDMGRKGVTVYFTHMTDRNWKFESTEKWKTGMGIVQDYYLPAMPGINPLRFSSIMNKSSILNKGVFSEGTLIGISR